MSYDPDRVRSDFDRIARLPESRSDQNAIYHRELLGHVPQRCGPALEVGCGTGSFACLLAERAESVDALDLASGMIAVARRRAEGVPNLHFEVADFLERPLVPGHYDVIASIATLHHVPLAPALTRLAAALKPGGTLIVLDLLDSTGIRELPRNAVAWLFARAYRLARGRLFDSASVRRAWNDHGRNDRYASWQEAVRTYRDVLPGTQLRRHLLWRYSAVWRKPLAGRER